MREGKLPLPVSLPALAYATVRTRNSLAGEKGRTWVLCIREASEGVALLAEPPAEGEEVFSVVSNEEERCSVLTSTGSLGRHVDLREKWLKV